MFGTVISAAAMTVSGESRRTPCDRHAYFHRSRGPQLIFELQRRLRGKRENLSLSPSRFCLSRDLGPRKQTGPKAWTSKVKRDWRSERTEIGDQRGQRRLFFPCLFLPVDRCPSPHACITNLKYSTRQSRLFNRYLLLYHGHAAPFTRA